MKKRKSEEAPSFLGPLNAAVLANTRSEDVVPCPFGLSKDFQDIQDSGATALLNGDAASTSTGPDAQNEVGGGCDGGHIHMCRPSEVHLKVGTTESSAKRHVLSSPTTSAEAATLRTQTESTDSSKGAEYAEVIPTVFHASGTARQARTRAHMYPSPPSLTFLPVTRLVDSLAATCITRPCLPPNAFWGWSAYGKLLELHAIRRETKYY